MLESEQRIEHLLVIEDNQGKRTIALEAATCSIGRDSTNSIVLYSHLVSRQHAILVRLTMPETATYMFRIMDGNLQGKPSANGLIVNGRRCFSHDLQPGDVIMFGGDVRVRYYATTNQSDVIFLTSAKAEDVSGFLANLINPFQLLVSSDPNFENSHEAALVRLASFPELTSNPILEIDMAGNIMYLNPAAVMEFPGIREARLQHPILAGLVAKAQNSKEEVFVREVEIANKFFEQSVHYIAESDLIRSYVVDVSDRKLVEAALKKAHNELEIRVEERTAELRKINEQLRGEIVERQRAEEALRESEERLHAILDNSTALIYVKDLQGRYILVNAWYGILFHLDREEFKGKTDYDLFPKEIADVLRVNDHKVQEAKSPLDWEEVVLQDDGLHTYLSIKFPLYDATGVPYATCGISTDITERKQAEVALRSSVATNRALLDAIPDSIFRIGKDGIFVNFKAAKENNLPMPASEFIGKHLYEVLPTEVAQPVMNCVEKALSTGEVQIFESQLLVNNNLLDYEFRIAVSAEDEVVAIVRDITERKQAEADIRSALEKEKELGELKSRFVTMASHEFRTPLATILSSTELIEHYSHKCSEEKKLTHLQRIQASVKQMSGLLNDVLLLGKAEAGKLEFNPTSLDVTKFCRELVEEMALTVSNHITFCTPIQGLTTYMDDKLLRHILSNLLSNAIKYSPQGGTVHFDLVCEQDKAVFQIKDQGIGIPVADQDKLFNSFHRASNVGTISGTGLGLAIVKKSVDLHGGKITVQSEVGASTTFTVTIPLTN